MNFDRDMLNTLFHYCLALTGEREEARDLLHNALESYLRNQHADIQHPMAYIRRIARNRYYDQLRRLGVVRFESLPDTDIHPANERELEQIMIDQLTARQLWRQLNPAEREVIFLWAVEGLSASEIALQLGQPRGTILSRLRRLRLRLETDFPGLAEGGHHGH